MLLQSYLSSSFWVLRIGFVFPCYIGDNLTDTGGPLKTKETICRLESMGDILKIVFKDGGTHAKYYRVSLGIILSLFNHIVG